MSYFADGTPHTYAPTGGRVVLNVGWLDAGYPFERGSVHKEFARALKELCQHPVHLHRGFLSCQFCSPEVRGTQATIGNGQIRVAGENGVLYAAPALIHHYVVAHGYQPPLDFVAAVLRCRPAADDAR